MATTLFRPICVESMPYVAHGLGVKVLNNSDPYVLLVSVFSQQPFLIENMQIYSSQYSSKKVPEKIRDPYC